MTDYHDAKSRGDTRAMHAAYIAARRDLHVRLARETFGRVKARRIKAMMEDA